MSDDDGDDVDHDEDFSVCSEASPNNQLIERLGPHKTSLRSDPERMRSPPRFCNTWQPQMLTDRNWLIKPPAPETSLNYYLPHVWIPLKSLGGPKGG